MFLILFVDGKHGQILSSLFLFFFGIEREGNSSKDMQSISYCMTGWNDSTVSELISLERKRKKKKT